MEFALFGYLDMLIAVRMKSYLLKMFIQPIQSAPLGQLPFLLQRIRDAELTGAKERHYRREFKMQAPYSRPEVSFG